MADVTLPRGMRAHPAPKPSAVLWTAIAGSLSLAVAMGIGRFAFTPILPMMLRDGSLGLDLASHLATANYLGYLAGAMISMALPKSWPAARIIRLSLVLTILLTIAMAAPVPPLWIVLRFLAGVASAMAFVFTSSWCLAALAELDKAALGSLIYTGPGIGIALSGLAAGVMSDLGWRGEIAWLAFGLMAAAMSLAVWPVFKDRKPAYVHTVEAASAPSPRRSSAGSNLQMALFTLAYGLAGFGYIITATYLPVIAKGAIPGSAWLGYFWPFFGFAAVAGSLFAARNRTKIDPRIFLIAAYLCQGAGVALTLILHTVPGFALSSLLVGLPFTAISFFAMQEVRRLRPLQQARFMGLLTATYGVGQMSGPPLVAFLLQRVANVAAGFDLALAIAASMLGLGAIIYGVMIYCWPVAADKARPIVL